MVGETLGRRLRAKAPPPAKAAYRRIEMMRRQTDSIRRYDALRRQPVLALRHLLFNKELSNFTYAIRNVDELVRVLAGGLGLSSDEVAALARELEEDKTLRRAIRTRLRQRPDRNDDAPYGRRIGWYVLARVVRPRLIVETGTHDGLGSAVLARALERNALDGVEGRLISIDVDPNAGWLVPDDLRDRYEQRFDDSIAELERLGSTRIDLAILDSDHSFAHERRELELVASLASEGGIVVSDNPTSGAFADFCAARNVPVYEFWEKPKRHIHPGAGLAFTRL